MDKRERVLKSYGRGELSQGEVCRELGLDAWNFLKLLKAKGLNLNVTLEDWLDSSSLGDGK